MSIPPGLKGKGKVKDLIEERVNIGLLKGGHFLFDFLSWIFKCVWDKNSPPGSVESLPQSISVIQNNLSFLLSPFLPVLYLPCPFHFFLSPFPLFFFLHSIMLSFPLFLLVFLSFSIQSLYMSIFLLLSFLFNSPHFSFFLSFFTFALQFFFEFYFIFYSNFS